MNQNLRKALLVIIAVLIALLVVIGASYAYMQNRIESQELTNVDLKTCAKIQLLDSDSNVINMTNTYPMDDKLGLETPSYEFTISSTCQTYVGASIYLTSLKDNSIEDQYIKFALRNDKGEILKTGLLNSLTNVTETDEFTQEEIYQLDTGIKGSHKNIYKSVSEVIPYQGSKNYSLQLWITSSATDKTVPFGSTFKLGVSIKAYERGMENYLTLGDKETSFYRNDKYRDKIKNVYFVDSIEEKTDSIAEWDLSTFQDSSIIGWLKNNDSGDENAPYDLYIGSNDVIKANSFENAFYNMANVETITLANLNTDELTTMYRMFAGTDETEMKLHEINGLNELNVSNVSSMRSLFWNDTNLTSLDLSNWNTESVTNMRAMFGANNAQMKLQEINGIQNFKTQNVTTTEQMFQNCANLTSLDLSTWDTSQVTTMRSMFYRCTNLTTIEGLENFNTENVTNMAYMFTDATSLESLNISGWDTASVTDMKYMFSRDLVLTDLNLSGWDTQNVKDMQFMFYGCEKLATITGMETFKTENVTNMKSMFNGDTLLANLNLSGWDTQNVEDMQFMFYGAGVQTIGNVSNWKTSKVKNMANMFEFASNLESLDVSNWDTSSVTDMNRMFDNTPRLNSIIGIKNFKTNNVIRMDAMFSDASSLTTLDLSGWDTRQVENMQWIFDSTSSLANLNLSNWKFSKSFDIKEMIDDLKKLPKLNTLNLSNWDTSNETNFNSLFGNWTTIENLNLSGWNTSNITSIASMFKKTNNLKIVDLSGWDTSHITDMSAVFDGYDSPMALQEIRGIDQWNTSSLTIISWMFRNCSSLKSLNINNWNVEHVTDMGATFEGILLDSLDFSNWNTTSLTNTGWMFNNCTNLTNLKLNKASFTLVDDYSYMFNNVPSNINVIVKDSAAQTFIQNRLGSGKGKVTIA